MKKFFILMLSAFCTWSAYAQFDLEDEEFYVSDDEVPYTSGDDEDGTGNEVDRPFTIALGAKVGLPFTTMSEPSDIDLDSELGTGFSGGLAANFHFGRRTIISKGGTGWFGLHLEALYASRSVGTDSETVNFRMFEVPILAQLYVTPNVCIEAGPTFVAAIGVSPEKMYVDNQFVAIGEMKANDVMFTLGAGYKSPNGLFANARYNIGTSDVAGNFDSKMSVISLSIGWLFTVVK